MQQPSRFRPSPIDARAFVLPVMGTLAGLLGLAFLVIGTFDLFAVRSLEARGRHADGVVTGITGNKGPASASVEFRTNEGDIVVFRTAFQGVLEKGDQVRVIYLPESPKGAHVDSFQEMWGTVMFRYGFGLVASIASIVMLRLTAKLSRK